MNPELSFAVHHPSHASVGTSRGVLAGRSSLIATLRTETGAVQGEATPLSGFGDDSIEAAELALSRLDPIELAVVVEQTKEAFTQGNRAQRAATGEISALSVVADFSSRITSPSARFCVETMILGAAAGSCGVPIARLLTAELVADTLPQSAVIDPLRPDAQADLERQLSRGVRAIKVKVGRDDAAELSFVRALSEHPSAPRFRLDPNLGWSEPQAQTFLGQCDLARLDWVEDPTPNPADWPRLSEVTGARFAIDEPLARSIDPALLQTSGAHFVVLKPMVLGGFSAGVALALRARELGQLVIVSHLFDGPVAMDACAQLAFAVQSPQIAPGLGQHEALEGYEKLGLGSARSFEGARLVPAPRG